MVCLNEIVMIVVYGTISFAKSFDKVPHKRLLHKLEYNGTTAGDWDCVTAVERLPALHHSVDFIFLSFGIMGFIAEL